MDMALTMAGHPRVRYFRSGGIAGGMAELTIFGRNSAKCQKSTATPTKKKEFRDFFSEVGGIGGIRVFLPFPIRVHSSSFVVENYSRPFVVGGMAAFKPPSRRSVSVKHACFSSGARPAIQG